MSRTLELTRQLINIASITPEDNGCLTIIAERLDKLGFELEWFPCENAMNLWARKGQAAPLFCFAGHTDVVEPGPLDAWTSPPFSATVRNGYLYGRGAADMKSSIAAFVVAVENFLEQHANHTGSIALLITSAEEGPSELGTPIVLKALKARGEKIDYCLVGEPSSDQQLGDTIKNGRRGSLHGHLTIHGKQGHIAYPHLANNPIHLAAPALELLTQTQWDEGNDYFQPTSFQISNIHSGTGAGNVIPQNLTCQFNFRFSPVSTVQQLKQKTDDILQDRSLEYDLTWSRSGDPFLTESDSALVQALSSAIHTTTSITPTLSTLGGTSDGRFIATVCPHVIEFGMINASIHQIDECVKLEDLEKLPQIYGTLLNHLLN